MITIVDYGLGNIRAFVNLYEKLNVPVKVARQEGDLEGSDRIILPGVGAFDFAISKLNTSGMREPLEYYVSAKGVPVLGICVGMQIMAKSSEEGCLGGLGWIDGEVKLLDQSKIPYKTKLPHMGWNSIDVYDKTGLFENLNSGSRFYFLHSYYFECQHNEDVLCSTEYGIRFASAVSHNNIFGVQFHPEKSHSNGIRLLYNFSRM